jgi:hypothetical protein
MSRTHNANLCLKCWFYVHGKCVKGPDDYCKITKSK